jgi:hypothetical protein
MDRYSADAVAIHFVATFRDRLPAFEARQRPADEAAVTVGVRPSRRIGPALMLWTDMQRRLSPIN